MPREGHDATNAANSAAAAISIHVPREGHDLTLLLLPVMMLVFQSTCPARGTTNQEADDQHKEQISIHVPREGHDRWFQGR